MNSNDWPRVRLGDHVDLLSGFAFKSQKFTDDPNDIPLVKGANVHQGFIDWVAAKRWPVVEADEYERFRLRPGDVVVAMDRPWIEAGLKYAWITASDPPSLLVQRVARLRGVRGLDTRFLRFVIGSEDFTNYIKPIVTGVNVPHISGDQIRAFEFLLPPLLVQKKVAAILSGYDELIANNTRRIAVLEEMAQSLYREWFVCFRFPGHEQAHFIETEKGRVPEGWHLKPLVQIADLRLGKMLDEKKNKGDLMPYLANINVRWGQLDLQNLREMKFEIDELEGYGLRYGDIVMCEGGEPGRCAMWTEQVPRMMIQKAIHRIRPREQVDGRYLYYNLRHKGQTGQLATLFTGSTIKHLPREKLATVVVEVPAKRLMDLFAEMVKPMACQVEALTKKNENLRRTRDLILPKLISGEVDVEHLDIDTGDPVAEVTT